MEKMRQFKALPVPDFEKKRIEIMPSGKPATLAHRPVFHADFLPPTRKSMEPAMKPKESLDFKF